MQSTKWNHSTGSVAEFHLIPLDIYNTSFLLLFNFPDISPEGIHCLWKCCKHSITASDQYSTRVSVLPQTTKGQNDMYQPRKDPGSNNPCISAQSVPHQGFHATPLARASLKRLRWRSPRNGQVAGRSSTRNAISFMDNLCDTVPCKEFTTEGLGLLAQRSMDLHCEPHSLLKLKRSQDVIHYPIGTFKSILNGPFQGI